MRFNIMSGYVVLVLSVLITGCFFGTRRNLPVAYVEGVITMDGVPLEHATVQFIPKRAGPGIEPAGGYTGPSGKYVLSSINGDIGKGALPGEYDVFVSKAVSVPVPRAGRGEDEPIAEELKLVTPEIYMDRKRPRFDATVVKGKNTLDFDLKSKPQTIDE